MATSIDSTFANTLGDHLFRGVAYSVPSTIYVNLVTDADAEAGSSRVSVAISAFSSGQTSNTSLVTVTSVPFGSYTRAGIWDAASSGNRMLAEYLDNPVIVTTSTATVTFDVGKLLIQLTGI